MTNLLVNVILLALIATVLIVVLAKTKTMNKNTVFIVLSLLTFWFLMYMQKNSPTNQAQIKHDLGGSLGGWIWPIIAGLYQLMQVATRVPYGILSQKLGSRKQIVQISFFLVLVSLTLMIASGLATWSLIVAAIAMGQYGATFGLDSQYISENHNIKKVYISSAIAFSIPVIGSLAANVVYDGFKHFSYGFDGSDNNAYFWIIFVTLMLGFVGFISYSLMKEDKATICLDNLDPRTKPWSHRGYKDIWAVSLTAAFMAFAYNLVLGLQTPGIEPYWMSVLQVLSLGASAALAMYLKKFINGRFIRKTSLWFMLASLVMMGILFITGDINKTVWVILMAISSLCFGMYVMALFGAALHFDHKFPALVLGIFLSVKSFALGTSTLTSGMIVEAKPSDQTLGIIIIAVAVVFLFSAWYSSALIVNRVRDNDMDKLIDQSFKYELGSSKLVVSK